MLPLETLLAYLPPDRMKAIAAGSELPSRTEGAALWADLSGFTPLTETLTRTLGSRHGAEELALHLNRFYDALIAPVDRYGGSVVSFSGDAITCWFDADDGRRAIAAAQAMQAAMKPFAGLRLSTGESISLGLKTAVATGSVRRFQVGDPAIQRLDTLAGATLDRLAAVGAMARAGELLLDEETVARLHESLRVDKWRTSKETGCRAAVLNTLDMVVAPALPASHPPDLTEEQIRPWLLPAVFACLQGGQGEFLTELRPAVSLFMRFEGLDYEGDSQAGDRLDAVIRQVQNILVEYDGTLLQLTIGDKGSYLYAAFGAPVAHEDDATRAVAAALKLSKLPARLHGVHSTSIGLSRGTMRTGAYGAATRRTYGVLGDEVNLAARLMEYAAPGQVLASQAVWQVTTPDFNWERLPALKVKGKRVPVLPAALLGQSAQETLHLPQAVATLPMVGRQAELALVEAKLDLVRQGRGQIVSITGEAGMGKSRLLAEALRRINSDHLPCYGGECQSYGTHSSYLVWQPIWRAFFGLDPASSPAEQIQTLEKALARISPDLPLRLPLLGAALNLSIPDNGLTGGMDARTRKTSREALLVDCIRARADKPLVLVAEDLHWIDPLSRDLLELIGRVIEALPVLILLAYRPPAESDTSSFLPGLASLEHATEICLTELTRPEIEQLAAARLARFGLEGAAPAALVERMLARTQGNPFYIEELLNYLRDKGLDPRQEVAWEQTDLPDSLHSLILSRIDQLSEQQQITIKAASVIGRLFRVAWLYGYYPSLGRPAKVSVDLAVLSRLELIALETPEPQLAYLFKHVITREVAYESLAYATRAHLHEQFARYLELTAGQDIHPFLDLLAFHYERSDNLAKKREYLRRAGEAAQAAYANEAALSYLARALALAPATEYAERFMILLARVNVYAILGIQEAQEDDLAALSALAEALDDNGRRAQAAVRRSNYAQDTSDYPAAIVAAQQTVEFASLAGVVEDEARGYWLWGQALVLQGNYIEARARIEQGLALAQRARLIKLTANSLMSLGYLDNIVGNYDSAQTHLERALQFYREIGDLRGEYAVLTDLGENTVSRGDFRKAQALYEQLLHSYRSIGYKQNEGIVLSRLGSLLIEQRGDYAKARLYTEQALHILQGSGERLGELVAYYQFSLIELAQNNYIASRVYLEKALYISREIGAKYYEAGVLAQLGSISDELGAYASALDYYEQSLSILRDTGDRDLMCQTLTTLGTIFYHLGQHQKALEKSQQALSITQETKNKLAQNRALTLQGHALRDLGDLDQSADSYQRALSLALELGLPHYAKQAQTGLACIALARGNPVAAYASMDEILEYLETTFLSSMDEIFWIYLTCYRTLRANDDPRARATLNAVHSLLQEIAVKIDDASLRASFLQNVRFNRDIVQAWERLAA